MCIYRYIYTIYIYIIIIFLHGLGRLTRSGIDALPSFPGSSTISSPPWFVVEGVFRNSGVVRSFEMVDPVLFVFGSHFFFKYSLLQHAPFFFSWRYNPQWGLYFTAL